MHELLRSTMTSPRIALVRLLAGHDVTPAQQRCHRPLLEFEGHRAVRALIAQACQHPGLQEVDLIAAPEANPVAVDLGPGHRRAVVVVLGVEQ
jgi:hypothetical protein